MEVQHPNQANIKQHIKACEGRHIQQVAYSSYHDALTQVCFTCKMVRTSLKESDVSKQKGVKNVLC